MVVGAVQQPQQFVEFGVTVGSGELELVGSSKRSTGFVSNRALLIEHKTNLVPPDAWAPDQVLLRCAPWDSNPEPAD